VTLPLFDNSNYKLTSDSEEVTRRTVDQEDGKKAAAWHMRVPRAGPDGVPFKIIFAGPNFEQRGSAFRIHLVTSNNEDVSGSAQVVVETSLDSGEDRKVLFEGNYEQFAAIPDQRAFDAAIALQQRSEVGKDHIIRLKVSVAEGTPEPDLSAEGSFFEIEVYKIWMNISA
jgi:hypothetical protein